MTFHVVSLLALLVVPASAMVVRTEKPVDIYALRQQVLTSAVVLDKITKTCKNHQKKVQDCESRVGDTLFCQLLERSHPDLAKEHCSGGAKTALQLPSQPRRRQSQRRQRQLQRLHLQQRVHLQRSRQRSLQLRSSSNLPRVLQARWAAAL